MATNITISMGDDEMKKIKQMKEEEKDFNLSGFFQDAVNSHVKSEQTFEELSLQKKELGHEIAKLQDKEKYLDTLLFNARVKDATKSKEEADEQAKIEANKELNINNLTGHITHLFNTDDKTADALSREFHNLPKATRGGIYEFGKSKGLVDREILKPVEDEA